MAGFTDAPFIQHLAVPAVCILIAYLSYYSQLVFNYSTTLEPGPLLKNETYVFNTLLLCLWYTYYRAVTVDPGRYVFKDQVIEAEGRWCRKCQAPKPPRSHHCRHCDRCVPKMDHHCPWTKNCVSLTTFPHFLRFLVYANVSLWYLGYLLWKRFYALWEARHMPAHLGPSLPALVSLAMIALVWSVTSLALFVMLFTTAQGWVLNRTTIESWEIDRHEANLGRGGRDWWDITSPDGEKIRLERVEFPYDVGFFTNLSQAMGTSNFLLWFFPFAGGPKISKDGKGTGWTWEENGFNRMEGMWPPLDPDRLRRTGRAWPAAKRDYEAELRDADLNPEEQLAAFKQRQAEDAKRRKKLMAELEEVDGYISGHDDDDDYDTHDEDDGTQGWKNDEGERLMDFGVDEEAEDQEEDVPIAELLRRRNVKPRDSES